MIDEYPKYMVCNRCKKGVFTILKDKEGNCTFECVGCKRICVIHTMNESNEGIEVPIREDIDK